MELEKYKKDVYKCTRCGYCREMIRDSDGTYLICPVREIMGFESYFARGRMLQARHILEGKVPYSPALAERVYSCMTCGNCKDHCGAEIDLVSVYEAMREDLANAGSGLDAHRRFVESVEKDKNPYFEPKADRLKWANGIELRNDGKLIYFVGCTSSYRRQEIAKATAKILERTNADFRVMADEWCCGSPLLRTGYKKQSLELARHNLKAFEDAETIITSCAGCYKTIKLDYPKIVGEVPIKVLHTSEYVLSLIRDGRLEFNKEVEKVVTYHDPCHLSRGGGVYEAPREVLKSIPGITFKEMYPTGKNSLCCGAGGGVKSGFKDLAVRIAEEFKIKPSEELGVNTIVTTCPFCKTNMIDAAMNAGSKIEVVDLAELI